MTFQIGQPETPPAAKPEAPAGITSRMFDGCGLVEVIELNIDRPERWCWRCAALSPDWSVTRYVSVADAFQAAAFTAIGVR